MKLRDLFKRMATRAGIAETDAKFTAALELIPADADVDDEVVANPLTQNLITTAEAEANPKIKAKFTAEALNGIDALLEPVLADFFDEKEIAEIKADKATSKRLTKLIEKAKAAKTAGGNSAETAQAITNLNNEIAKLKTDKETDINTLTSKHQRERFNDKIVAKLLGRTDIVDSVKSFDGVLALRALDAKLEKVGGTIDYATGKIVQKADNALPLFVDNKEATIDGLLDSAIKENDWVKKSDGPAPTTVVTTTSSDAKPVVASAITSNLTRASEKMKAQG